MKYSEMLREILRESHWTQEQLAAKLGVSFATVNSWVNGRTEPQKSLAPEIQKLYLAQDVTNEPEPIYITLIDVNGSKIDLMVGDYVVLRKNHDNNYDDETIEVSVREGKGSYNSMYVANSVRTVVRGTRSSGRIYDKFNAAARAQVMFVFRDMAIARVVNWNIKNNEKRYEKGVDEVGNV